MNLAPEYLRSAKFQTVKPGLDRCKALLASLGNPQDKVKMIHVAGTNGKGSVCACLSSVLSEAGYKTGLYTSPFVVCYNERYQICGEYIGDAELTDEIERLRPYVETMDDLPSQFEIETVLALDYFARQGCDVAVMEVGMGGQWDATNVIPSPEAAVICAVALDHCAILGNTVGEIAAVKAGIIKSGCEAVVYDSGAEADAVYVEKCAEAGAVLHRCNEDSLKVHSVALDGCRFDFAGIKDIFLPLSGSYQPRNAALAITVLHALQKRLPVTDGDILRGLAKVRWPGRFELLRRDPIFILDGSHNPHGMKATASALAQLFGGRKLIFLVSVMADKDVKGIFSLIAPMADCFIAVEAPNPRAMKPAALAELLSEFGVEAYSFDTIGKGVEYAVERAGADGIAVALGTLYFSAEVRRAVAEVSPVK